MGIRFVEWLLSLSPQHRAALAHIDALESEMSELKSENLRLEDRIDSVLKDRQELWDMVRQALNNERAALQTQINIDGQMLGRGIQFPDAHALPANRVPEERKTEGMGRQARALPSEVIAKATRGAWTDLAHK